MPAYVKNKSDVKSTDNDDKRRRRRSQDEENRPNSSSSSSSLSAVVVDGGAITFGAPLRKVTKGKYPKGWEPDDKKATGGGNDEGATTETSPINFAANLRKVARGKYSKGWQPADAENDQEETNKETGINFGSHLRKVEGKKDVANDEDKRPSMENLTANLRKVKSGKYSKGWQPADAENDKEETNKETEINFGSHLRKVEVKKEATNDEDDATPIINFAANLRKVDSGNYSKGWAPVRAAGHDEDGDAAMPTTEVAMDDTDEKKDDGGEEVLETLPIDVTASLRKVTSGKYSKGWEPADAENDADEVTETEINFGSRLRKVSGGKYSKGWEPVEQESIARRLTADAIDDETTMRRTTTEMTIAKRRQQRRPAPQDRPVEDGRATGIVVPRLSKTIVVPLERRPTIETKRTDDERNKEMAEEKMSDGETTTSTSKDIFKSEPIANEEVVTATATAESDVENLDLLDTGKREGGFCCWC